MTKIEMPVGVVQTLTGKGETMSLEGDKSYKRKITLERFASQLQMRLKESSETLAKREKKLFPKEVWLDLTHRIFAQLIDELSLSEKTKKALLQTGLTEEQVETIGFRNCPSEIENRILCYELEHKFGDLSGFPGFVRMDSCRFRLNLLPYLRHSGILMPYRDSMKRICCLSVFRSVQDTRGFYLRSSWDEKGVNNEY